MGCWSVRGDDPRALASGLFYMYVQVNKHGITILYISVDLAHRKIVRAKVGKDGISLYEKAHTMTHRPR